METVRSFVTFSSSSISLTLVIVARVTTLKNHKMAVTSVDWKNIGGKSFIATCADDQVRDILRFQSSCCTS